MKPSEAILLLLDDEKTEKYFINMGEQWLVKFGDKRIFLNDRKRLRYLLHLIDNPSKEIRVQDLRIAVEGEGTGCSKPLREYSELTNGFSYGGENIQPDEVGFIKDRVSNQWKSYQSIKSTGAPTQIKKAQDEWERLKEGCSKHGIKIIEDGDTINIKQYRQEPASVNNKNRVGVKKNIENALNDIKNIHPELYSYLKDKIETGSRCYFRENPEKKWCIKW
jgi:hypothetical protein